MIRRAVSAALAVTAAAAALAGCSTTLHLEPLPYANDPQCAAVSVRLPDTIGQEQRKWTDAQATAAWGEETSIIFACGQESPAPTTLQCVSIGGVDWIVDETDFPNLRMTTYGRTPAAEVYVDTERVSSNDALSAVAPAAGQLERTGECVAADEATQVDEPVPNTGG